MIANLRASLRLLPAFALALAAAGTAIGAAAAELKGIDADFAAAAEADLRAYQPDMPDAVVDAVMACMMDGLLPVLTDAEKRQAIDTNFSEELGAQLREVHTETFQEVGSCIDGVMQEQQQ